MKFTILIFVLNLTLLFNPAVVASTDDLCGNTSGTSSSYLPTSGIIKIYIIFAQFKDDPNTDNYGWAKNEYPSWANNFINSAAGGSYPWNNLSHYFNEMSNGNYQVIGDVYNSLVKTDKNFNEYGSIGEVNREILLEVDPYVDFSKYDNLNGSSFGTDGKVDYIHIIYRNVEKSNTFMWYPSTGYYSAVAHLPLSSNIITDDGVDIVSNSFIGGGVQQRNGYAGRDYTMYIAAHEMGHYLFKSASHIDYATNLCLMSNLPVWNGSRGMHSWERQKLGWISYLDKATDGSVTLTDYMTTDMVYRVPVNTSIEYFLLENRKKYSPHDKAAEAGIYFYKITNGTNYPPTIDVLCADGNWNFSVNTTTQTLSRTTPNVFGKDEMNYMYTSGGKTYACYNEVYGENSAWGDNEDAFDLTFNNVLSPVSNPRTTNSGSIEFSLEITGTNTVSFFVDGDGTNEYAGSPSKPQYLRVIDHHDHPLLTWNHNTEPDKSSYYIYRKENGGSYSYIGNTSSNVYTDSDVYTDTPSDTYTYKIRVKDTQNKYSLYSNEASIYGLMAKEPIAKEGEELKTSFNLGQNYPNPYNPTTTINYYIKEMGNINITIYDALGRTVKVLVNDIKQPGEYSILFNGTNLSNGVYYYRMQAGNFVETKKMLMMK